jgi:hypothetical protein
MVKKDDRLCMTVGLSAGLASIQVLTATAEPKRGKQNARIMVKGPESHHSQSKSRKPRLIPRISIVCLRMLLARSHTSRIYPCAIILRSIKTSNHSIAHQANGSAHPACTTCPFVPPVPKRSCAQRVADRALTNRSYVHLANRRHLPEQIGALERPDDRTVTKIQRYVIFRPYSSYDGFLTCKGCV